MSLHSVKSRKLGSETQKRKFGLTSNIDAQSNTAQKRKLGLTSDTDAQSNTSQPPPTPSEGLDGLVMEGIASSDSDGPPSAPSRRTNAQKPGSSNIGRYDWEPSRKNESAAWKHYKEEKKFNAKGKRVGECLYCGVDRLIGLR